MPGSKEIKVVMGLREKGWTCIEKLEKRKKTEKQSYVQDKGVATKQGEAALQYNSQCRALRILKAVIQFLLFDGRSYWWMTLWIMEVLLYS